MKSESMRKYMKELRETFPRLVYENEQLPDASHVDFPTVTLHRKQVIKFRVAYESLVEFCADVCDVEKQKFSEMDIFAFYTKAHQGICPICNKFDIQFFHNQQKKEDE